MSKALFQIHIYVLNQYGEVRSFIDKYAKRYSNLVIDVGLGTLCRLYNRSIAVTPRLRIYYEDGKKDVIEIGSWKEKQILDFCDSTLKQN